jgi:hypothetical protein
MTEKTEKKATDSDTRLNSTGKETQIFISDSENTKFESQSALLYFAFGW